MILLTYICFSNGFLPLINKPTRVTKYSATIIDNIITNDIVNVSHIQGLLLADISDHFPIFIIHKNIKESNPDITFQKRVITYKSLSAFRTSLEQHSFQSITSLGDINDASSLFCSELRSMYEKHFPLKSFKRKYSLKKPWLTEGLKQSIRTKNLLFKKYMKNPTDVFHKKYKIYRNKIHHLLKCAERNIIKIYY